MRVTSFDGVGLFVFLSVGDITKKSLANCGDFFILFVGVVKGTRDYNLVAIQITMLTVQSEIWALLNKL